MEYKVSLNDTLTVVIEVDLDSNVPLIDQLVEQIRGAIARGDVSPGDGLPSVRQLAGDLGVNQNTVARAYRALESQGLVHTARGRGTRVSGDRSQHRAGQDAVRAQALERLRTALADLRLAGWGRDELERALPGELGRLWPLPDSQGGSKS